MRGYRLDGPTVISGVFTIPFSATEQMFVTAAAEGLPSPVGGLAGYKQPQEGTAYRLEFIAGPENQLVRVAASTALDSADLLGSISPLVLYGPAGCGKSHLARGIAAAWRCERSSPRGVIYMAASEWAPKALPLKRFVSHPTTEKTAEHAREEDDEQRPRKQTYEIDLLVLEDLHLLRQSPATFTHFRAVFDELIARGVPIVLTSRLPPDEMMGWPVDIRARLRSGMQVPIVPPGTSARCALLLAMAEIWQIRLTPAAAERLASGLAIPAPQLLISLAKLCAEVAGLRRPITVENAECFVTRQAVRPPIELKRIANAVLRKFSIAPADLTGKSRRRHIVAARSVVMFLSRELTNESLARIGLFCGGRDHTTTLHNCRKIAVQIKSDPHLRQTIEEIRRELATQ